MCCLKLFAGTCRYVCRYGVVFWFEIVQVRVFCLYLLLNDHCRYAVGGCLKTPAGTCRYVCRYVWFLVEIKFPDFVP